MKITTKKTTLAASALLTAWIAANIAQDYLQSPHSLFEKYSDILLETAQPIFPPSK